MGSGALGWQDGVVSQTKIVIAAGGTAGHVAPALAVAGALRAQGARVEFIGGERAEAQLVPAAGYPLHAISVEGVSRTHPLRAIRALARATLAVVRARAILRRLRPDAVLGGGGYVTAPVGIAALSLRIPLVLSEADSHLGLANRLLAPRARCVCLAFPLPGREARHPNTGRPLSGRGARHLVTGRPIPVLDADRLSARERLGIAAEETCVLVFGGSLGARSINLAAMEGLAGLAGSAIASETGPNVISGRAGGAGKRADARAAGGEPGEPGQGAVRILHAAGRRDYPELSRRELPVGYDLREYLDLNEFAQALAAADLAVARAGGSVAEIAAYGLPAILIPYPHASADHQAANARWMERAGAAVVIPDGELTPALLAGEVRALLADRARLAAMAQASKSLARPGAAQAVADELMKAAGAGAGVGARQAVRG